MPAVTETLSECLVPNWGISKHPLQASTVVWFTPFTSLPNTTAYRWWRLSVRCCSFVEPSTCSMLYTKYSFLFNSSTASVADAKYRHATLSSPPRAVLCISGCGGVAVMPHRYTASTRKASHDRNTDPTLYNAVSYTHLRAHETSLHLVCRLLLEKKKR